MSVIPRGQNILADALAILANNCKMPFHSKRKYVVEVKHKSTVPDNVRYWQVFGNDEKIENLLQMKDEFESVNIDIENDIDEMKKK